MSRSPISAGAADPNAMLVPVLRDCAKADRAAFKRLYELTAAGLLGQLVLMTGDRAVAEAVLEDGFVYVWQHANEFNPGRQQPLVWLQSVMRRHARERGPMEQADESFAWLDNVWSPDQSSQPPELATLTDEQLRCLKLVWLAGKSPPQAARCMGIAQASVRRQLRRCLEHLLERPA
jgi:DNA-directed RNA polymerase specialized sigma24 family protein